MPRETDRKIILSGATRLARVRDNGPVAAGAFPSPGRREVYNKKLGSIDIVSGKDRDAVKEIAEKTMPPGKGEAQDRPPS